MNRTALYLYIIVGAMLMLFPCNIDCLAQLPHGNGNSPGGQPPPASCSFTVAITPSSVSVKVNQPVTFKALVTFSTGFGIVKSYQWSQDGVDQPGATGASFTTSFPTTGQHQVCCKVTAACVDPLNSVCWIEWWLCELSYSTQQACASATVTSGSSCTITASLSPSTATVCVGANQTFTSSHTQTGTPGALTYQWYLDGQLVTNTSANWTTSFGTAGTHTVTVTINSANCGSSSASSTVTVNTCTSCNLNAWITPSPVELCVNQSQVFTVNYTATGGGTPTFLWTVDGVNSGTTSSITTAFAATGSHTVNCKVTVPSCGNVTAKGIVNVTTCGTCTLDAEVSPTNSVGCVGGAMSFEARAIIAGGPSGLTTYQWYVDNSQVVGALSAFLNYTFTSAGSHTVACKVTVAGCGSKTKSVTATVMASCNKKTLSPGTPIASNQPSIGLSCSIPMGHADVLNGSFSAMIPDPVATRGYPLTCNIVVNSQTTEFARPMANAAFTYDMHILFNEQVYDLTCNFVPHYMVVDADGSRRDFGPSANGALPTRSAGIFSTLVKNPDGTYSLNGAGGPGAIADNGNFNYLFDSNGKLLQLSDDAGNTQTVAYSGGKISSVTDVNTGRLISFTYTGNLIANVVENGQTTLKLTYVNNAVTKIEAINGSITLYQIAFAYNGDGSVRSFTRDNNSQTTVTLQYVGFPNRDCANSVPMVVKYFDSFGGGKQLIRSNAPVGGADESIYVTNASGGQTRFDFTGGLLGKVVTPPLVGSNPNGTTFSFTYNADYQCITAYDGANLYNFGYTLAALTTLVDPVSGTWSAPVTGSNQADTQYFEDGSGYRTNFVYGTGSSAHRAVTMYDTMNQAWNFAYNGYGQLTQVQPPAGSVAGASQFSYDENVNSPSFGWFKQALDGLGNKVTVDSYDILGDPLQISTYPSVGVQHSTQFTWDAAQRLVGITHPDGKTAQWNYSGLYLNSVVDEAGSVFGFGYCSPCGIVTSVNGPLNWGLSWTLDSDRDITGFIDARGNRTNYNYGLAKELTSAVYPDGTTQSFEYDAQARPNKITNGRGQASFLQWTSRNELLSIASNQDASIYVSYVYNQDTTLQSATSVVGTNSFTYNGNGQVLSSTYLHTATPSPFPNETVNYSYTPDGLRSTATWLNNGQTVATWSYAYDLSGRLTTVTANYGSASEPTTWTYDGEDKLLGQLNANGTSTQFTYNELRGWPTSITQYAGPTPFATYGLTYDGGANTVGNLTSIGEVINGQSATISYSYDALYRLTGESRTGSASHSYVYDLAGNVTSRDSTTYTVDSANKLLSDGLGSATYDGDGNTLTMSFGAVPAGSTFQWDALSRLTNYNFTGGPTGGVTNKYDAFGRRVFRDAIPGVSPATIFVYDGDLLLGEVGTDGTPLAAYTWGAAGLISRRDLVTNTTYWYHFGPQGETRQVTNSTGTVVGTYVYNAYGALTGSAGAGAGPFQYGGQFGYYTDLGGFVLCGARWYEPRLGRWLSRDPIGYDGGDNLYAYCDGDPINQFDSLGTDVNCLKDWYMGGMGGLSDWVDRNLMFGTTQEYGSVAGRHDAGQASDAELLWAGSKFSAMLGANAVSLYKFGAAAVVGVKNAGVNFVTRRLQKLAAKAASNFKFTTKQANRLLTRPGLEKAFKGTQVDTLFKGYVDRDWILKHVVKTTGRFRFGPDVVSRWGNIWWDLTTEAQWTKHVAKYAARFGRGFFVGY